MTLQDQASSQRNVKKLEVICQKALLVISLIKSVRARKFLRLVSKRHILLKTVA
jgi:hypothetical protein